MWHIARYYLNFWQSVSICNVSVASLWQSVTIFYIWEIIHLITSDILSLVTVPSYFCKVLFIVSALYPNHLSEVTIFLYNFWSISILCISSISKVPLSWSKIFLADFGPIHGIAWKNLTSTFLSACWIFACGNWDIWNAVLGQTPFILSRLSKSTFCSIVSKQ